MLTYNAFGGCSETGTDQGNFGDSRSLTISLTVTLSSASGSGARERARLPKSVIIRNNAIVKICTEIMDRAEFGTVPGVHMDRKQPFSALRALCLQ